MDKIDLQILEILQKNGRATIKQISQDVHLTSPSVTERIRRMEETHTILGYHAEINPIKLGKNLMAFIGIDVKTGKYESFSKFCDQSTSILCHYRVIGAFNAILFVALHDSDELKELIDKLKCYGTTNSSIILSTPFKDKLVTNILDDDRNQNSI